MRLMCAGAIVGCLSLAGGGACAPWMTFLREVSCAPTLGTSTRSRGERR